jgi:hypothetical protein
MHRTAALALLLLAACATATRPPAIDLAHNDVVDLTYAFDEHTLYWPNSPGGFELKKLAFGPTPGGYFYSSYAYSAPEHGGTHLDAPSTSASGGGPSTRSRPRSSSRRRW